MTFPPNTPEKNVKKRFKRKANEYRFKKLVEVDDNPNIDHPSNGGMGPGDLIGIRNGEKLLIEVETHISGFFIHPKWVRKKIDVIVCNQRYKNKPEEWKREELEQKEIIVVKDESSATEKEIKEIGKGVV